jgi:hypothetical protein
VKSYLAEPFFRHWRLVPGEVKQLARKNYRLWKNNPRHRSLRFKPVRPNVWAARIGLDYRVLGRVRGDAIYWFWVGDHREYEKLLKRI